LSKRKQGPREERRREQVELNLLSQSHDRGNLSKARQGCTLPFLGGGLLVIALELVHVGLS
jgi:hypothetical protein